MTILNDFFNNANDRLINSEKRRQELEDFQFPNTLSYDDLQSLYDRSALAQAVVDRFSDGVFSENPIVIDGDNADDVHDETPFERDFNSVVEQTGLWNVLRIAYAKNRIGNFSTMYLVFDDSIDPSEPVRKGANLVKIQTFNQKQLKPYRINNMKGSIRYGDVETFMFNDQREKLFDPINEGDINLGQEVHHSRVIVIAEGADPHSYDGVSALARAYNGIKTYDRILGASSRGFVNASRGALKVSAPSGVEFDPSKLAKAMGVEANQLKDALEQQIDDFNSGFDKMLLTGNLEVSEFNFNLPDPEPFAQLALNAVAASCRCPAEKLIGSQLSQKASDTNESDFNKTLTSIRNNFINEIIKTICNRLIELGVVEEPSTGTFRINWNDLEAASEQEQADLANKLAAINVAMANAGQEIPFTADEIRVVAGYKPIDDIDLSSDM